MLGSPCNPCCGNCPVDGKDRTDPTNEGTWEPSGEWPSVTWSFSANTGNESGNTWFFFGSGATSIAGRSATLAEQQDWGNLCNWYSHSTASPISATQLSLTKRATRLPDENAVIYVVTPLATNGTRSVASAYFLLPAGQTITEGLITGSELITTSPAHEAAGGAVFLNRHNDGTVRGGALFSAQSLGAGPRNDVSGEVFGGAVFRGSGTRNRGTVNGNAEFVTSAVNSGLVNGNAEFIASTNSGTVDGDATFSASPTNLFDISQNQGTVSGFATFTDSSNVGTADGGALFLNGSGLLINDIGSNAFGGIVNGGATFNLFSRNDGIVNGGAEFNNSSRNSMGGTVNGGAVLNDGACSLRFRLRDDGMHYVYVLHPSDLPTCNGTALSGEDFPPQNAIGFNPCGCG
jgi:hypothetical protein